ncbi:MAG: glycosyltransferase family protein [Cytophagales bacterium]
MKKAKFIVQAEGRGHFTQAYELAQYLESRNITVSEIWITYNYRPTPTYFLEKYSSKIKYFHSPTFSYDSNQKGLNIFKTFLKQTIFLPRYIQSIYNLKNVSEKECDYIFNFYEPLAGLAQLFVTNDSLKYIPISHHFYLTHPDFQLKSKHSFAKNWLIWLNKIVSINSYCVLALSFRPAKAAFSNIKVIPPLLKKTIIRSIPETQNYVLAYSVNQGYLNELLLSHQKNSDYIVHYFGDVKEDSQPHPNFYIHKADATLFEKYLVKCSVYMSTAGFDSIAEALYLQKKIILVPVRNHLEQYNNALDAQNTNKVLIAEHFDLSIIKQDFLENQTSFDSTWLSSVEIYLNQIFDNQ